MRPTEERASTILTRPHADGYESWLSCVRDFDGGAMDGSGTWMVDGFAPGRPAFEALLHIADTDRYRQHSTSTGHVPCTWFWILDDHPTDPVVGFLALRHHLDNAFLAHVGGHIGYSVRPSRRRQGHASQALALAVLEAGALGLDRVLVTCAEDNRASAATIESRGGVFESVFEGHRRYWISTSD